jgi:mannose-6-phosphate isomerase-like protein (cupin superfamily)
MQAAIDGSETMETLPRIRVARADMMKRVARFDELAGFDGGLPDSKMPGCIRTLYNVIGFQPPEGAAGAVTSPVGADASRLAAIKISEGFNLGYCRAKPGNGPMMHNHDTNETFIPMTGTWRCSWENETGETESVDLGPLDVVSFPPGVSRRFENVTPGDPNHESILMFVIGGDGPKAEFTDESMQQLEVAGVWPAKSAVG